MTERIVVGVDGGGTKTDVCVVTDTGAVRAFVSGGGSNWESVGLAGAGECLHGLIEMALRDAGVGPQAVTATAYCLAGVDWPSDLDRLAGVVAQIPVSGLRTVDNDSFAALRAGTESGVGCVSIAGTGGVAAARNERREVVRTMGIGVGEGSGAHGLVGAALAATARAHNRGEAPTMLTDAILQATDCASVPMLFERISRGATRVSSGLSVHVLDAARSGDAVAIEICRSCGAEHGRDTAGVAGRVGLRGAFDVVLAGGVHVHGAPYFRDAFASAVAAEFPEARFTVLTAPPVIGAAMLALEAVGVTTAPLHAGLCAAATTARARETSSS